MRYARVWKMRNYDLDDIVRLAYKNKERLVKRAENNYKNNVEKVVNAIKSSIKDKRILFVCGPSSSGKTTTSNIITQKLEKMGIGACVVSMDNFFINRADTPKLPNGNYDYENVTTVNLDLFKKCMDELLEKGESMLPIYDFVTGVRTDNVYKLHLKENTLIIVEGLHAFNPLCHTELMKQKGIKLYVCPQSGFLINDGSCLTPERLRFIRRAIRDFYHRGHKIVDTENTWKDVRAGEDMYVVPYRGEADYIIDTTYIYEPLLYENELIKIANEDDGAKKYIKKNIPKTPLTKADISKNSLVWEFLGA